MIDAPPRPQVAEDDQPAAPRRRVMPGAAAVAVATLVGLCVVVLFFGLFAFGLSALQEQRSQAQLYASFRGVLDPSSPVAPAIGGVIPEGTPIALISAPAGGLGNVVVVEGTSPSDLLAGPGHLRDSPLPGQPGESILMGRSVTAGAPFGGITSLRKGDVIKVTTGQGTFRFVVVGSRVAGDPLPTIPKSGSLLTLVTSAGSGWLGALAPTHVVYVDADLVGTDVAAPTGRPVSVPPDEIQGAADPNAWPFVVFWLEGLLAVGVGAVWLWSRWGAMRAWLIGAPVVLAVLWGLSTQAMRLLPNVF